MSVDRRLGESWKVDGDVEYGGCFTEMWTHESGALIGLSTNGTWEAVAVPGYPLVGAWTCPRIAAAHAVRGAVTLRSNQEV